MLSVSKEFTFEAAHMLSEHEGECKNLHGHSYKLIVEATGDIQNGMIIDFKDLKNIVKETIIDKIDHSFIYYNSSKDDVEHKIAEVLKGSGKKIFEVNYRPTAENMAMHFYNILNDNLKDKGLKVVSITLYETQKSFAKVVG
ncbi:6-carboxytetrahydropterin synthase QueD [Thermobrachium celere]|uniref:6-carboxy-5,6,7,8-tetrahydropterin synthase n=1 Tax=Thermobrachium celere DSM 8682 TaxID=941824 RepID=R7RTM8_9CLOT|nr:6-carboxytetrahydropterin synthase QueD [Thermobrachium celere]CDF59399.1 Queuosine biosynthesis QueD, PTPS-I [Thermobrachium celere DSM 8682]